MCKIINRLLSILIVFLALSSFSQNVEQRKKIADSYDRVLIKKQTKLLKRQFDSLRNAAFEYARINNEPTVIENHDGSKAYLESIEADGTLNYVSVYNAGSATTSNVNELYEGGTLSLDLSGQGIVVGVWDDGRARPTHQEFDDRIVHLDNAPQNPFAHSTHVTGTIMASGVNPNAKGMAFQSEVEGYDFFNDIPEMQTAAASGMLLSNHSYGLIPQQLAEWQFGAYINLSRAVDLMMNSSPYYLPVFAAGNSRNNSPANNPGKNGFDLITGRQTSKNSISVANVLQVNNYTGPSDVQINTSSSYGPTDDLRIKPEIAAKGTNVFSSFPNSDNDYGSISGTSMASPAVTGTIALLQELYFSLNDDFMKSHQVRALLCGTTLPAGSGPQPDVRYGFGLMDAEKAADAILNNGFTSYVDEIEFTQGQTYTETFTAIEPDTPIEVTIAWNDPAGDLQPSGQIDFNDPRLVNDLDLRIFDENGNEFQPSFIRSFIFQHSTGTGDNDVDNIEKIHIANPSGQYTVQVTHKGSLQGGQQDFAIVVTGVGESPFNVLLTENTQQVCPDQIAEYTLNYAEIPSFEDTVSFSAIGLPAGVQASFLPETPSGNDQVVLILNNLASLSSGSYNFQISAEGPSNVITLDAVLNVLEGNSFEEVNLIFPTDSETDVLLNPTYSWSLVDGAQEYLVEVSTDADFNTVLFSESTVETSISFEELAPDTLYYWRVSPTNECIEGDFQTEQFSTEVLSCNNVVEALDLPLPISSTSVGVYESVITVPDDFVSQISKLRPSFTITHSYVEDLIISLISPQGTEVVLIDQICGGGENIDVMLDDTAEILGCNTESPAIFGTFRPLNLLNAFIGEDIAGDWTLRVQDVFDEDGGAIESFSIDFCDGTGNLSSVDFSIKNNYKMFPNPATNTVNFALNDINPSRVGIEVYTITGKLVNQARFDDEQQNTYKIDTSQLSTGVYVVKLNFDGMISTEKLIIK